ncbi:MAG: glycosyl hydrolase family 28-related protein, partial [Verrucomicrobiota bacterium]
MKTSLTKLIHLAGMLAFCLFSFPAVAQEEVGTFPVSAFGAKGDGKVDDTAAITKALAAAGKLGGRVLLPPGRYLVAGSLRIPPGVTLEGGNSSPVWSEPLLGVVILATGGRDQESAPALFELGHSATVRGLTVWYPEQKPGEVHPYPWTFHLQGHDNTVENITLINSYNGIRIGPENNVRHRIRSVVGCVLRRGIFVDFCTDIGRIENVQFHCHWWSAAAVGGEWKPVHEFMSKNLEAFVFGRTDWEYVNNTFVFPVNIGYRFIATTNGAANGQFTGIGADEAQVCVKVDAIQPMGLLITGGQFVCMHGDIR